MTGPQQLQTTRDILVGKSFWEEREKIKCQQESSHWKRQRDRQRFDRDTTKQEQLCPLAIQTSLPQPSYSNDKVSLIQTSPAGLDGGFPSPATTNSSVLTSLDCGRMFFTCLYAGWGMPLVWMARAEAHGPMHPRESVISPLSERCLLHHPLLPALSQSRRARSSQPLLNKDQGQSSIISVRSG